MQKYYRGNEYTRNNKIIVGRIIFYAVRIISKEIRRLVLPWTFHIFSLYLLYITYEMLLMLCQRSERVTIEHDEIAIWLCLVPSNRTWMIHLVSEQSICDLKRIK
jgi:uncharacterized membrane protein YvlD (DUF360 family)